MPHQTLPTNSTQLDARLVAVDARIAAIDERLAEIRQRLLTIDRTLAVPAQIAANGPLATRFGTWLAALGRPAPARPLASAPSVVSSL